MTASFIDQSKPHVWRERAFLIFMRVISIIMIVLGMSYWGTITGYADGSDLTFSQMSVARQTVTIIYAVWLPVMGVGMWFGASWGIGMLLISLAIRFTLEFAFTEEFVSQWIAILLHVLVLAVYGGFRIARYVHG